MAKEKTHTDKTSADNKAIGFDFQYYYFIYRLLYLKHGETIGLEVKDDVHTELSNNRQILVQVKHTVQKKVDGNNKSLTELDIDLWKTIYNWVMVICDVNDGRSDTEQKLSFVKKTDFLLASNKSSSERNKALKEFQDLKQNKKSISDLKKYLCELMGETKNDAIKGYINTLIELEDDIADVFIRNICFELNIEDIIMLCKRAIKEKMIDDKDVDDLFNGLDSQIRQDNFITIISGEKVEIVFEEFHKKYKRHFDNVRNKDLTILPFIDVLPEDIETQVFIRQLIDIEDIHIGEIDMIAEYTRLKIGLKNNVEYWVSEGELTRKEIEDFEAEAKSRWKNAFRAAYRGTNDREGVNEKAVKLVDEIRKERLSVSTQEFGTELSNGEFYNLSDIPEIGWDIDWEEKYK